MRTEWAAKAVNLQRRCSEESQMTNPVDLYRQILRDAKKVGDKKLACLVQKRFNPYIETSPKRCANIIPFPAAPVEQETPVRIVLYEKRV